MKNLKLLFFALLLVFAGNSIFAQKSGTIKGTVLDEKNKPAPFIVVAVMEGDKIVASANTDDAGDFAFKNIVPGKYDVKAIGSGYNISVLKDVISDPNQIAYVNFKLTPSVKDLPVVTVDARWEQPKINQTYTSGSFIDIEQIELTPVEKGNFIQLAAILTPAVMPTEDGKDLIMRGSRRGASAYYVDGMRTMDVPSVPGLGISNMQVLTGGIPAEFGDVTGGVIIIDTKDYLWEMKRNNIKKQKREEEEE